jgi:hypothetical protein
LASTVPTMAVCTFAVNQTVLVVEDDREIRELLRR